MDIESLWILAVPLTGIAVSFLYPSNAPRSAGAKIGLGLAGAVLGFLIALLVVGLITAIPENWLSDLIVGVICTILATVLLLWFLNSRRARVAA